MTSFTSHDLVRGSTTSGSLQSLDHALIERMHAERRAALLSLADDITPALYAALREKIEYERAFLIGEVETQEVRAARSDGPLDNAYFTRKRLGPETF